MDILLGQLAALGTALCWTICSPCFTLAGRRIGSLSVNIHRLVIGGLMLSLYGWLVRGRPLPTDIPPVAWGWLVASGLIGFFLCDMFLFRSFLLIGPRLALLIMTLAPVMAAAIDWAFRAQTQGPWAMLGMAVTLGGVIWVVLERPDLKSRVTPDHWKQGVTLALLGAVGQAVGMVTADIGIGSSDPFAATQIRLFAGLAGFLVMITVLQRWKRVLTAVRDGRAMGWVALGALTGPFLGVSLGLLSLKFIPTGTAMTLMALPPVLILPVAWLMLKEPISLRAAIGAAIAVAGVAILFLC